MTRAALIWAIVAKDLRSFARDKLWLVLTPVSIGFVAAAFWLAPSSVDDTLWVGVSPPEAVALFEAISSREEEGDGFRFVPFDTEARMVDAIAGDLDEPGPHEDDVSMGLAFPTGFAEALVAGADPEVVFWVDTRVPPQLRTALASETREAASMMRAALQGRDPEADLPILIDDSHMVLGEDRAGNQVSMRDKLRPMLAILILMLSAIAIAGLVAVELERRTAAALLVTPVRVGDFLMAKGITGTVLGVSQVLLFLLVTWSFGPNPAPLLLLLLLGAAMMASMGMIAGSAGREFMSTMFLSIALIIPMTVPTFAVLFPGSRSLWVKLMPSYGFTEAMVGLMGYGRSPGDVLGYIGLSALWTAGLFLLALVLLRRRVGAL